MGLIEFISPKWAYRRSVWRAANKAQRNYDAGQHDRLNRNWRGTNESAEQTDKYYRDEIRGRSRDLERNSDLMNANVHPWVKNVVGSGFTLESRSDNVKFDEAIERLWSLWCKKENCDVTGSQSFWEMMRMAVRRKRIDGGILFVKCNTDEGLLPFKLQALEVDELDITHSAPYDKGNRVVGGVEYNSYNRAVGFWIKEYDIEGYTQLKPHYIPSENVIFYFSKTRPSQIREMPEMSATIGRIKDTNGYIEAASIKERIAACLSVFIKKVLPTGVLPGRNSQTESENQDYDQIELSPGLIQELNAGDEIDVVNPGASATNGGDFIKSMSRLIAAGQGISYEAASRDLSQTNYSSARQASIEDEETFRFEQEKLMCEVVDEVYKNFVLSAALTGSVDIPSDFWSNTEKYISHEWKVKPKRWIDPLKEANANKIAIESGQKTLNDIWRENGKDYKTVLDDIKRIQDYAAEIGLKNFPFLTGGNDNGQ